MTTALASVLLLALLLALTNAQAPRDNAAPRFQAQADAPPLAASPPQPAPLLAPVQPASAVENARVSNPCTSFFRTFNGVCTNPIFKLWGSTSRAQSSLFPGHSSKIPTGKRLPSARLISNKVCKQSKDILNDRWLNELVVFFGQFIDHTFVASPASDEFMNIPIPKDDPIFSNFSGGQLQFRRSQRAKVDFLSVFGSSQASVASKIPQMVQQDAQLLSDTPGVSVQTVTSAPLQGNGAAKLASAPLQQLSRQALRENSTPGALQAAASFVPPDAASVTTGDTGVSASQSKRFRPKLQAERPINSLSSALDLASVYGPDKTRANALRAFKDGKLKVSKGSLMPLNTQGLSNAPTADATFFLAGDHRANEHPVLTALHTIFMREHNSICDELKRYFVVSDDELIFQLARMINIAQFQKIVFEEYYPAMVGRRLKPYTGFKFYKNVAILDVFSTAAFRVGHTMVGNEVSRAAWGNRRLPPIPLNKMFFRTAAQFKNLETFIRGAAITRAQEVDVFVHDALRNFLFTGVPEEGFAFDLIALNLQRGRDHAIPTLNAIRERLGLKKHRSFFDITKNMNVASTLSTVYGGDVEKVEAWVGMVAEDHVLGSSLGPTMIAVWTRQFENLRDGDRFYYLNDRFPSWLQTLPRVRRLLWSRQSCLKDIIVRNSNIRRWELGSRVFFKSFGYW
eukprot:TRINITY_DN25406_c0_g1_i1.p1 TRINITY_DN25406_c0_g1~~TRINITY_DN25406_c0_g1_i1.p1  ORF type:complete len:691 (+),score=124.75 TRINITY_DN25406_c0_g1_i1:27-2075(+)